WRNEGSAMSNGSANSDVDAGPDTSRSMTLRRVGSARAWKIWSSPTACLGTCLSMLLPRHLGQALTFLCSPFVDALPRQGRVLGLDGDVPDPGRIGQRQHDRCGDRLG